VDREGIDTESAPSALLERAAIRSNGAVTGADINEVAVADAGEHSFEDPLVLPDFGKILLPTAELAERHLYVSQDCQLATLPIVKEETGGASAVCGADRAKRCDGGHHH
jgi:hypothetical protein